MGDRGLLSPCLLGRISYWLGARIARCATSLPRNPLPPRFFRCELDGHGDCKKMSVVRDILEEQGKIQEANLVIFQDCFSY